MTKLIAIEGVDSVGKSTQCKLLQAALADIGYKSRVVSLRLLPGFDDALHTRRSDSEAGTNEIEFFVRFWEKYIDEIISPEMNLSVDLDFLITDRYIGSFLAYQSFGQVECAQRAFENLSLYAPTPSATVLLIAGANGPWLEQTETQELGELERSLNSRARQEHVAKTLLGMSAELGWKTVVSDRDRGAVTAEVLNCLRVAGVIT